MPVALKIPIGGNGLPMTLCVDEYGGCEFCLRNEWCKDKHLTRGEMVEKANQELGIKEKRDENDQG